VPVRKEDVCERQRATHKFTPMEIFHIPGYTKRAQGEVSKLRRSPSRPASLQQKVQRGIRLFVTRRISVAQMGKLHRVPKVTLTHMQDNQMEENSLPQLVHMPNLKYVIATTILLNKFMTPSTPSTSCTTPGPHISLVRIRSSSSGMA
jgi:hypothetical protein